MQAMSAGEILGFSLTILILVKIRKWHLCLFYKSAKTYNIWDTVDEINPVLTKPASDIIFVKHSCVRPQHSSSFRAKTMKNSRTLSNTSPSSI